jgi:hypothetical protein
VTACDIAVGRDIRVPTKRKKRATVQTGTGEDAEAGETDEAS